MFIDVETKKEPARSADTNSKEGGGAAKKINLIQNIW